MSTLTRIQLDFYRMRDSMKSSINSVLHEETTSILSDLQDRSPVDSGLYRGNWKLLRGRFTSKDTISSVTFSNKTPYAYFMEFGAKKDASPWYFPKSGSKTGKLTEADGEDGVRIWAGGLNPGHSKTIGGAGSSVLTGNDERLDKLANNIANAVMRGFK